MINFDNKNIILFDGICNLCNSSVQFIINRDKKDQFLFSSLQSDASQQILLQNNLENLDFKTILLIENGKVYSKSTAILRIAKQLSGLYPVFYGFIIIPKPIRDFFYTIISKNRYKWFGKKDSCMIPTTKLKAKFLS